MQLRFSIDPRIAQPAGPEPVDVVVDAEDTLTVGELSTALRTDPGDLFPGIDPDLEFSETGIRLGTRLGSAPPELLPPGYLRLETVGGPYSGECIGLPGDSSITLGRSPECNLAIADPTLEERHLILTVPPTDPTQPLGPGIPAVQIAPATEAAVVLVGAERITETTTLGPDDIVQIGENLFRIGRQPEPNANIVPDAPGRVAYNRSSRILPTPGTRMVKLPGEAPDTDHRSPLPWLSALIPVVIGVVAAIVFGRMLMLLFAAASPLMVIGTHLTSKAAAKRSGKRTTEKWREEIIQAQAEIATITRTQHDDAWHTRLDPVQIEDIARTPTARLWERRIGDADALSVRIGAAEEELRVSFEGRRIREAGENVTLGVAPVPFSVDLGAGVTGIAGPRAVTLNLARAMICELAVCRSPRDLSLVLFCADTAAPEWSWFRWLPHADTGNAAMTRIGNTEDTRRARLSELSALLAARKNATTGTRPGTPDSHVVVLLDNARSYRSLPGMVSLLSDGSAYGIHVIALEDDRAKLPEESVTEVRVTPGLTSRAEVLSAAGLTEPVLLDSTTPSRAEAIARALAPIVHVGGAGDEVLLPASVRFVDLLGVNLDDPTPLLARWAFTPRDTRAVVGAGMDGPFAVDLAADGPHGLVAGTTGAGKSEFLQTLVTSLALANRPDALNFVLVDYKGGSAFADCEWLPHTVGMVTNLDGRETERALESLDAELQRRETVLKAMGAKDADTAWEKDPDAASRNGLARLVLVIDEFAELKAELPDFVTGLVRIARVGRSLGVHLILATQRPAGAITPEMQSNTNLRVALRVTDKADSTDVLGSPEAAAIAASTPGRGYVRRGVGAQPSPFQTARVAGRRPGVVSAAAAIPKITARTWRDEGLPALFRNPASNEPAAAIDHDDTDLRALVAMIDAAATETGIPKNPSPWLEPLPGLLTLADLPTPENPAAVVLGLEDIPSEQAQRPLLWNIETDSHIALIGGARSGRTSVLRSLAAQLAGSLPPTDLQIYAIDMGNGALSPLGILPHTGAVITPVEMSRVAPFIDRLQAEVRSRQHRLARGSYGSIAEQRRGEPSSPLAFITLLIDGWERLLSELGDESGTLFRDQLTRLLREGPAVGLRVILTADRGIFSDRIRGFIEQKYLFALTDRGDYGYADIKASELPEIIVPGRMFFGSKPLREVQTVLLSASADGNSQHNALLSIAEGLVERWTHHISELPGTGPFRIDALPDQIALSEALALPILPEYPGSGVTIAVGGDTLSRYTWDRAETGRFLVAGARKSGRSSTLTLIAEQLRSGAPLLVVSPRTSPLRAYAVKHSLPLVTDPQTTETDLRALLAGLQGLGFEGAPVVLIDDMELIQGTTFAAALLAQGPSIQLVGAIAQESMNGIFGGLFAEVKSTQQGIMLSPTNSNQGAAAFSLSLPSHLIGKAEPGRASVRTLDGYELVQVPRLTTF